MRIVIVGEAWGEEEERQSMPFVGPSGKMLWGLLRAVGISREDCFVTNVFNFRPRPSNDIKNLCKGKSDGIPGFPPIASGKYISMEFINELDRLYTEILNEEPTVILALGATAAWALLKTTGIRNIRGAPLPCVIRGKTFKVLSTYHPAAILREFSLRPILFADLQKLKREMEYPEIRRPQREIWIEPTFEDLLKFESEYITPSSQLSIDIETIGDQITCIGFAPDATHAIVVPFTSESSKTGNYWPDLESELRVWKWVRHICSLNKQVIGQNFLYDIHFLWRNYGITVPHATDDTMLLHHALQPEMEKGLGFLGSIYTDEASWKFMRKGVDTIKRDE